MKNYTFMQEDFLEEYVGKSLKEIIKLVSPENVNLFKRELREIEKTGDIFFSKDNKMFITKKSGIKKGKVILSRKGNEAIIKTESGDKIYISKEKLNLINKKIKLMHLDNVLLSKNRIIKTYDEYEKIVAGEVKNSIFKPYDKRIKEIFKKESFSEYNNMSVFAKISKSKNKLFAEIHEEIGKINEVNPKKYEILGKFGFLTSFSKNSYIELEKLKKPTVNDFVGRIDYRNDIVFTLDGKDSKDLDDAISLDILLDENNERVFNLRVHIADVSHYVKENSTLDIEALDRGVSVYLPNLVIPMFPEKISNDLCSLNPNEDKLTMTCSMIIDKNGDVISSDIHESVINTSDRMNYDDVDKIIKGDRKNLKKYSYLFDTIDEMDELRKILASKRLRNGAIDFNEKEGFIEFDESGNPSGIKIRERNDATNLVEEFMIAANETVAKFCFENNIPSIYRVHDMPDKNKVEQAIEEINSFSSKKIELGDINSNTIQRILNDEYEKESEKIAVVNQILKTMSKAKYTDEPSKHFGLSLDFYTHFTSPIRRYADLQVHRNIKEFLINKSLSDNRISELESKVKYVANRCTVQYDESAAAESLLNLKLKAEYVSNNLKDKEMRGTVVSKAKDGKSKVVFDNTIEAYSYDDSLVGSENIYYFENIEGHTINVQQEL